MKEEIIVDLLEEENAIEPWATLDFPIDENYEYQSSDPIFQFFSDFIYYGIAFPVLKILTKMIYDFKIEGKENLKKVKTGAVSVSNHVLVLDCAMVGLAWGGRKVVYTTQEESFQIPFVRKLIRVLNAIPIPKVIGNRKFFIQAVNRMLKQNEIVHFYPEAVLHPYSKKIRDFKNGAFDFAIKNEVPVVPMVFQFREPKGIRKILKKKKDVTLCILEPVFTQGKKGKVEDLKNEVREKMQCVQNG